MKSEFDLFCEWAGKALANRHLHSVVQKRLSELLAKEFPDNPSVAEVFGVEGGRNDLIHYEQSGRRAVFELFCSPSQVPQDLRLLEQAEAHWKFAVLLDREIRTELADTYFHKKPNPFPFLWLSQVMMPGKETDCRAKLRFLLSTDPMHSDPQAPVVQTVNGRDNVVAHTGQGDININQKKILRPKVVREDGDISEEAVFEIQDLIRQLAQTDEIAGKSPSYGEWQQRLKNRYKVASYRKLSIEQGADAVGWLKQQIGRKLPSLRRSDNDEWRQRIYKGIWTAARELGWEKPQVYEFAIQQLRLKKRISSLTELGEQKLESLRDKIRYQARKSR